MRNAQVLDFPGVFNFAFPTIKSLRVENVTFREEWVEGDIVLRYDFNGEHVAREHFKTKLNEETSFDVGPLKAVMHVWLDGPKLWLGLKICLGPLCTPEMKTSIDIPH